MEIGWPYEYSTHYTNNESKDDVCIYVIYEMFCKIGSLFIMPYEPYKKHGMASSIYTKRRI